MVLPLSKLRDRPFLVLLGEPGIGKTTALKYEAAQEDGDVQTCREVMAGTGELGGHTAYLDALDEFRSGENGRDKLLQLAKLITEASISRWRLTCRAEDWRNVADLNAMRNAAGNHPITVASLLPLDTDEAIEILAGLGADDPDEIVREANAKGAMAFLESPLSVRLLYSALLSNGGWPETRYDLFDKATLHLAWEHDDERVIDDRPSADDIILSAEKMCFYQLATGAKAIWRANSPPPGGSSNDYVPVQALSFDHAVARFTLDTALFRGEGHAFEPFHKTVAEYLGGRYLARRVTGKIDGVRFPVQRAKALISSHDGKAASEMRGLFAWFTAHLSRLGDHAGALTLIDLDAATVLAYSDAAVLRTDERRTMLHSLDRDDPYFLSSRTGSTVLGGLAGEDLVQDFIEILDSKTSGHRQLTVLEALRDGTPLPAMQTKLREIVLDDGRQPWQRGRAGDAWVKIGTDRSERRLQLYSDLESTPITYGQISLRAGLLADLSTGVVCPDTVRRLLTDLNDLPAKDDDTHHMGALLSLLLELKKRPRADYFDKPSIAPPGNDRGLKSEVRHFLQGTLASAILASLDIGADRLWGWLRAIREYEWDRLDDDLAGAVAAWIERDPDARELQLFEAIADTVDPRDGAWVISNHYIPTVRRAPSGHLLEALFSRALSEPEEGKRRRGLEIAAWAVRTESLWPIWKDRTIRTLEAEGTTEELVAALLSDPNAKWKEEERARKADEQEKLEATRAENVKELSSKVNGIAVANPSEHGVLSWAAVHYRDTAISESKSPLAAVEKYTNSQITSAIAEGLVQYAIHVDTGFTVADFGVMEAKNSSYRKEYVVAAGVHQLMVQGRASELNACPLITAIIALRHRYFGGRDDKTMEHWAMKRLAEDPALGAEALVTFWLASINAGGVSLDFLHLLEASPELAARALTGLLQVRPDLEERPLKRALSVAAAVMSISGLLHLTKGALASKLDTKARAIWSFARLALKPKIFAASYTTEALEPILLAPDGELFERLQALSDAPEELDNLRIRVLGRSHPAHEDYWNELGSVSRIVRAAIQRLQASTHSRAGAIFKELTALTDPSWTQIIAHAAAEQARLMRDKLYSAPSLSKLRDALADGPPANPADLVAIVCEELGRYRRTLRTGSETPWKRYWNTDENGAATKPQIENEDRDRLLELLRPQFERYGIVASAPEARMAENTRVDILLLSYAGKTVPIEAKRHYNSEIWTAPLEQLAGYAQTEAACGYGVYLVFWFGTEFPLPPRKDGNDRPASAHGLETLLTADLPPTLKDMFTVIVLDVSRPEAMIAATTKPKKPRQRKAKLEGSGT
ncbi:NACHT domain-containing NTPase [Rhizobium ruizarguesonis]